MTLLLVTTVRRHTPATEPSGFVYTIDLEGQKILQRSFIVEPAFREIDNNPRGGLRGYRGIALRHDEIALANATMVFRYDPQWNLIGYLTHPACSAIHDIQYENDGLWVTSASNDLLFHFDCSGRILRYFYMRSPSPALQSLDWRPPILIVPDDIMAAKRDFRHPRAFIEEHYDWAHVNSVCLLPGGDLLVSLGLIIDQRFAGWLRVKARLVGWRVWPAILAANRFLRNVLGLPKKLHSELVVQPAMGRSAIVRISPDGRISLVLDLPEVTVPSHSLMALPDGTVIYLKTDDGSLLRFDPNSGKVLEECLINGGFLRGITMIAPNIILLGNKQELVRFDLDARQAIPFLRLTEDPVESVYDIKVLPAQFVLPPLSFNSHFEAAVGFPARALIDPGSLN